MKRSVCHLVLPALAAAVLLAGCAGNAIAPGGATAKIERISPEELERLLPKPVPTLPLDEVVKLSQQGTAADEIISRIKESGSRYELTPSQMVELNRQGVDARVLDFIQATREQVLRDAYADEINRREQEHQTEIERLQREQWHRPYYYDPFWPYGFGRYYYGPRGRYYWGW